MSDEIMRELKSHGELLKSHSEMLEAQSVELKSHSEMLEAHTEQLDLIATKLVEHDERFRRIDERMATKDDIRGIADTLDTLVSMAQKKDQELAMLSNASKRHEDRIERLEEAIRA